MDLKKLKEPFPSKEIKWRIGKTNKDKTRGMALVYIDARAVMDKLDEVLGPQNWQRKHSFGPKGEVLCSIGIKIKDKWIWKSDGAGQTNFEAEKGGLSDAFKRAGVSWGIARYLYNLDSPWVNIDQFGNIKNPPLLPDWALPESERGKKKQDYSKNYDEYQKEENKKESFTCSDCGSEITQAEDSYSKHHYNISLCRKCQKNHKKAV